MFLFEFIRDVMHVKSSPFPIGCHQSSLMCFVNARGHAEMRSLNSKSFVEIGTKVALGSIVTFGSGFSELRSPSSHPLFLPFSP